MRRAFRGGRLRAAGLVVAFAAGAALAEEELPPAANSPPARIQVVPGPGWLSVWWEPTGNPETLGYRIERASEENGVFVPLTAAPVPLPPFADARGLPGATFYYRVVSLDRASVPGPPSPVASGTFALPRAPGVPAGLVAERRPRLVRLRWEAREAPILLGYSVERQAGDGRWVLLTSFPTIEARYDDRLPSSLTGELRYRVTAVGLDGRVSAPALVRVAP